MIKFAWPSLLFFVLFVSSCGKDLPELEGMDLVSWKNDKNGCSGKRLEMLESIESEKSKLTALSEMDIVELLGKPDQNELYKRNQKFYTYFVQPSSACDAGIPDHPRRLVIRFNAMGLAKEVSIEN
jgi:hypothetical protein